MGKHDTKTPQGKPSGSQRGGTGLKEVVNEEQIDSEIENSYLDEDGQPAKNTHLRHENRNTDKGRDDQGKDSISI
jgi:hypothetical protein